MHRAFYSSVASGAPREARRSFRSVLATGAAFGAAAAYWSGPGDLPGKSKVNAVCDEYVMKMIRMLSAENAHKVSIQAASYGLTPKDPARVDDSIFQVQVFNQTFPNPIGMAAGFDKHAEGMTGILDMGFGFVEIGSVTPEPQPGNPQPRNFRLVEDRAVINRYGFNSEGAQVVKDRLEQYVAKREKDWLSYHRRGVLGVNLGKNKTTTDAAADYITGLTTLGPYADYLVINVSSPNTPGLRNLQGKQQLKTLIARVVEARDKQLLREDGKVPLLVKIAPDLTEDDKRDIADVVASSGIDGLIISNTTISRPASLQSEHKAEGGGLSGEPVRELSTQVLYDMYKLTKGKIPIVGVGGVATGQDAYDKIRAGATLVQMYSSLVYEGPGAVVRAKEELRQLLERDGYTSVQQAVGAAHREKK